MRPTPLTSARDKLASSLVSLRLAEPPLSPSHEDMDAVDSDCRAIGRLFARYVETLATELAYNGCYGCDPKDYRERAEELFDDLARHASKRADDLHEQEREVA